jgi:gamma-tubulin complex component 2
VNVTRLQNLLYLTLKDDSNVDDTFKEDLKVTMSPSGLYEWLQKVVSVSGVIGGEEGDATAEEPKKDKKKDDKNTLIG